MMVLLMCAVRSSGVVLDREKNGGRIGAYVYSVVDDLAAVAALIVVSSPVPSETGRSRELARN